MEIFHKALEMREMEAAAVVSPNAIRECRLKVAKVMNNIGCVNYERKNYEEARESFEKAIKIQRESYGSWNPFARITDITKPGFLTMASTMCNKGSLTTFSLLTQSITCQKRNENADSHFVSFVLLLFEQNK